MKNTVYFHPCFLHPNGRIFKTVSGTNEGPEVWAYLGERLRAGERDPRHTLSNGVVMFLIPREGYSEADEDLPWDAIEFGPLHDTPNSVCGWYYFDSPLSGRACFSLVQHNPSGGKPWQEEIEGRFDLGSLVSTQWGPRRVVGHVLRDIRPVPADCPSDC